MKNLDFKLLKENFDKFVTSEDFRSAERSGQRALDNMVPPDEGPYDAFEPTEVADCLVKKHGADSLYSNLNGKFSNIHTKRAKIGKLIHACPEYANIRIDTENPEYEKFADAVIDSIDSVDIEQPEVTPEEFAVIATMQGLSRGDDYYNSASVITASGNSLYVVPLIGRKLQESEVEELLKSLQQKGMVERPIKGWTTTSKGRQVYLNQYDYFASKNKEGK